MPGSILIWPVMIISTKMQSGIIPWSLISLFQIILFINSIRAKKMAYKLKVYFKWKKCSFRKIKSIMIRLKTLKKMNKKWTKKSNSWNKILASLKIIRSKKTRNRTNKSSLKNSMNQTDDLVIYSSFFRSFDTFY